MFKVNIKRLIYLHLPCTIRRIMNRAFHIPNIEKPEHGTMPIVLHRAQQSKSWRVMIKTGIGNRNF